MGGEHEFCWHNIKNNPCSYIHHNNDITYYTNMEEFEGGNFREETDRDRKLWPGIKDTIINFLMEFNMVDHAEKFMEFNSPKEVNLWWHNRNDQENEGKVLHDITKILIKTYPEKYCAYFDRCLFHDGYDACTIKFGCNENPKYSLYESSVDDAKNDINIIYERIDTKLDLFNAKLDLVMKYLKN